MPGSNAEYFARRSRQERMAAQAAADPHIAAVHSEMATLYENSARAADEQTPCRSAWLAAQPVLDQGA